MEEKMIAKMLDVLGEIKKEMGNLNKRIVDLEKRRYTEIVTHLVQSQGSFGHCADSTNTSGGTGHCR